MKSKNEELEEVIGFLEDGISILKGEVKDLKLLLEQSNSSLRYITEENNFLLEEYNNKMMEMRAEK